MISVISRCYYLVILLILYHDSKFLIVKLTNTCTKRKNTEFLMQTMQKANTAVTHKKQCNMQLCASPIHLLPQQRNTMAPAFLCTELLLEKLQSPKALEREMCGNAPKTSTNLRYYWVFCIILHKLVRYLMIINDKMKCSVPSEISFITK